MHIGEVFNEIYDTSVGWRPASGSIKPVHVANGLLRTISGRRYNIEKIARFLIAHKQGGMPDPDRTFESLGKDRDFANVLGNLAHDRSGFERTRRYAKGLLAADKAVFPSASASSLSLTCGLMVSGDYNDRGLGSYGGSLISIGDGRLGRLLKESLELERPQDPITTLAWPLLADRDGYAVSEAAHAGFLKRAHNKEFMEQISAAADCLATHTINAKDPLRLVQRAVHFVCVATFVHAQALAGRGKLDRRPPTLLVSGAAKGSELAIASEKSLTCTLNGFQGWLVDELESRIAKGKPLVRDEAIDESKLEDGRSIRAILRGIGTAKARHAPPSEKEVDERFQIFSTIRKQYRDQGGARVLAQALMEMYLQEYESGGPQSFLLTLGRKCGFLYPHFQGRSREKRAMPNARVLEMIVKACVPRGEALSFDAFLERLWKRFGCVVGGRLTEEWSDADVLAEHGIDVEIEVLAANTECFVDELVAMGLARRYPDGVTFVGDSYGG
jgi:hypothetical protein